MRFWRLGRQFLIVSVVGMLLFALACNRILDAELCENLVSKAQQCGMPDLEMSFEAICLKYKGEQINDIDQLRHFTELSCDDLKDAIRNLSNKRQ